METLISPIINTFDVTERIEKLIENGGLKVGGKLLLRYLHKARSIPSHFGMRKQ